MVTDETFFAWLDGELHGDEAAKVSAEVAADPALAAKAEQHRAMQQRLKSVFDTVSNAPGPERLRALRPEPEVIDLAQARGARSRRWSRGFPQWTAIAATLAVGILVGTMVPHRGGAPVTVAGGKVYAAGALDRSLTTQLASAPSGHVRIGLTFRDQAGEICRTFTAPAMSGLGCRDGDRWQLRGMFAAPEGQAGSYRMAAGMDPNLAAMVGSEMAGEPLDAAGEKATRDKGWR
jgi:hypothetical protein